MFRIKSASLAASVALAALASTAPAAHADGSRVYAVGANSSRTINLNLCSPVVDVSIEGDHDTDVDFEIFNPYGRLVHSDYDETDVTYWTAHRRASGCSSYQLMLRNLGDVFNNVRVTLEDQ